MRDDDACRAARARHGCAPGGNARHQLEIKRRKRTRLRRGEAHIRARMERCYVGTPEEMVAAVRAYTYLSITKRGKKGVRWPFPPAEACAAFASARTGASPAEPTPPGPWLCPQPFVPPHAPARSPIPQAVESPHALALPPSLPTVEPRPAPGVPPSALPVVPPPSAALLPSPPPVRQSVPPGPPPSPASVMPARLQARPAKPACRRAFAAI